MGLMMAYYLGLYGILSGLATSSDPSTHPQTKHLVRGLEPKPHLDVFGRGDRGSARLGMGNARLL